MSNMSSTCSRREVIAGGIGLAAAAAVQHVPALAQATTIHVAQFGAKGDGVTNDTDAIHAASKAIERMGGGTLVFDEKTYIIGKQRPGILSAGWAFEPGAVIDIRGCRSKVRIVGNGAVLRCAPGLRYGTFDRRSGRRTQNKLPFTDARELASPYRAAIWLQENSAGLEVTGFEIDGQINRAIIGGRWGDTGWQINHCGLWIYNNRGPHLIRDIYAHHHGQDGLVLFTEILSESSPAVPMRVENFRAEYNGRQGISLTGGKGVVIHNCKLSRTGRNGVVASNPGAGLDIEAELSLVRDVTVTDCEFVDNHGQGMVADTGNSEGIVFRNCTFVGTTNYAAWPNKPRIRFYDCTFVGAVVRCFEDPAGTDKATQFVNCRFTDDPALSPTGEVGGWRIDLGGSGGGTLFDRCSFIYRHTMQLPYSPPTVRYRDCTMVQRSSDASYPFGRYMGTTRITAPPGVVHFGGAPEPPAKIILNGTVVPR